MRIPRNRVFRVTVNGQDTWLEPAGERTPEELQHRLVTDRGYRFVRVQEMYLGGAKAKLVEEEDEEV